MKRIISLLLVTLIVFTSACSYKEENSVKINVNGENIVDAKTTFDTDSDTPLKTEINSGGMEKIVFGHQKDKPITWYNIYEDADTKILLSEKILDVRKYNEKDEKIDWDKSTLYDYLNSDFVNDYFTSDEKEKMVFTNDIDSDLVTMLTIDNLLDLYGDMNYVKDGYYGDKEFFAANDKIVAKPEELALYNEIDVFDNETMAAIMRTDIDERYDFANGCAGYWLLNQVDDESSNVFYVTATGYIGNTTANTDYIGFRPIIRIKN